MTSIVARPATAVPEAQAIISVATYSPADAQEPSPGTTTVVGYTTGPTMVVDGFAMDSSQHPVTIPLFLGVTCFTDDYEPDDTVFDAVWYAGKGNPASGQWAPSYRRSGLSAPSVRFNNAPEVEAEFPTWFYELYRDVEAVVFEEGVSASLTPFESNALLAVVVLGGEFTHKKNAVFSWALSPPVQTVVSDVGEIQGLYGSDVVAAHSVYEPTTGRPLVVGVVFLGRRLVMVVADGTVSTMSAVLPADVTVARGAPLMMGQAEIDNEVVYGDMSVLKMCTATTDAAGLARMAADLAAEFGIEHRP